MSKLKYGEFSFSKPNTRPAVKGYAYGGATESVAEPMTAKQPMGMSPPPRPVRRPVVTPTPTPMSPAQKLYAENKANIDKANARDGGNRLIDRAAMKAALDRNLEIRKATDARHKAEAIANRVPASQLKYRQDQMDAINAQKKAAKPGMPTTTPAQPSATPMKTGGKVGLWDNIHAKQERIKHGSGEKMRKPGSKGAPTAEDFKMASKPMAEGGKADMAQDKAMIKKAMKQHDQQEHKGGKGTTLKLKKGGMPRVYEKKELAFLKKSGAPAKMIKHEEREMIEPMGRMKTGGAAKKGVPAYNKMPKIC